MYKRTRDEAICTAANFIKLVYSVCDDIRVMAIITAAVSRDEKKILEYLKEVRDFANELIKEIE